MVKSPTRHALARLRVLALVLAAVTVVVVAAPLVGQPRSLLPADGDAEAGVDGHPERIGRQWWVRDLPDRPGPVAALVDITPESDAASFPLGWFAVSERGKRWRLPAESGSAYYPTLSPAGRFVGYLAAEAGPYVLHDLTTGGRTEFPDIGGGAADPALPTYGTYLQHPSFWSPDESKVVLAGHLRSDDVDYGSLVLGVDGSLDYLPGSVDDDWRGHPVGWLTSDTVLLLRWADEDGGRRGPPATVTVQPVGLDGQLGDELTLRPSSPWVADFLGQWSGTVSPDGAHLLVVDELAEGSEAWVRVFSLDTGEEAAEPVRVAVDSLCPAGWAGDDPAVPVRVSADDYSWSYTNTAVLDGDTPRQVAVAAPRLGVRCIVWAAEALAGTPRGGLFGTNDTAWTWYWREIALGLVLLASGALLLWWWRRRRRRPGG